MYRLEEAYYNFCKWGGGERELQSTWPTIALEGVLVAYPVLY